jgi:hypothetical protein
VIDYASHPWIAARLEALPESRFVIVDGPAVFEWLEWNPTPELVRGAMVAWDHVVWESHPDAAESLPEAVYTVIGYDGWEPLHVVGFDRILFELET